MKRRVGTLANVSVVVLLAVLMLITACGNSDVAGLPMQLLPLDTPPPGGWPTVWIGLSTDDDEPGGSNHRDVVSLYYATDTQYLYLRMQTVESPGWPSAGPQGEARYKWWFDTVGTDIDLSGTSVSKAEFQLILEDRTNTSNVDGTRDRLGELTLMDDLANVGFTARWNQGNNGWYITNTPGGAGPSSLWKRAVGSGTAGVGGPQGVMASDIGYRIDNATTGGNFVDMYISWEALGNPASLCLIWATDNHNPNLDQAPNLDRPETSNCLGVCIPPVAAFNATPTSGCAPLTVSFADQSTGSITGWSWTFGDGGTSTLQNPSHQYTSAGSYNVTLNVTTACGSDTETETNYITVYAGPTATASSNSPVCEGGTIELYGEPDGMTSYSWTGPGGWTSSLQNPTRTDATTAMTGTYTLTVTNGGCTDDANTSVTVNAGPTATASSNSPVCEGGTIELYGEPDGMTSYSWTGPGGWTSSLQNPTRTDATTAMTGTYTLTVTNGGCTDDANTSVTVNAGPTADAGEDAVIISGDSVVIGGTPTASGGTPLYTYSWTPATGLNDASLANPTASPAVNTTYTVTVTDSNGCTDSDDVTVTVIEDCCICGFVYRAGTTEPLEGWQVILEKETNPWVQVGSAVTDANGKYCFCGLASGYYRVREVVQPGWTQVSPLPNEFLVTLPGGCCNPQSGPFLNFENEQRSDTVGWQASSVDRLAVMWPWVAFLAAVIVGVSLLVLRRRRALG